MWFRLTSTSITRMPVVGTSHLRLDARGKLPGLDNSLNLNDLWRKSLKHNFDEKYPLGTVHFLMWLYQQEIPPSPTRISWFGSPILPVLIRKN